MWPLWAALLRARGPAALEQAWHKPCPQRFLTASTSALQALQRGEATAWPKSGHGQQTPAQRAVVAAGIGPASHTVAAWFAIQHLGIRSLSTAAEAAAEGPIQTPGSEAGGQGCVSQQTAGKGQGRQQGAEDGRPQEQQEGDNSSSSRRWRARQGGVRERAPSVEDDWGVFQGQREPQQSRRQSLFTEEARTSTSRQRGSSPDGDHGPREGRARQRESIEDVQERRQSSSDAARAVPGRPAAGELLDGWVKRRSGQGGGQQFSGWEDGDGWDVPPPQTSSQQQQKQHKHQKQQQQQEEEQRQQGERQKQQRPQRQEHERDSGVPHLQQRLSQHQERGLLAGSGQKLRPRVVRALALAQARSAVSVLFLQRHVKTTSVRGCMQHQFGKVGMKANLCVRCGAHGLMTLESCVLQPPGAY